jgi:hypothetical protein
VFVAVAHNTNIAATITIGPIATHADATLTSSNGFSLTAPTNSGSYGVSSGVAAYNNDMPLTPGAQITVNVPGPDGAARVIWGAGRSFPSNAASSGTQIGIVLVAEGGGAGQWQRVDGYFNPVNYPFGGDFFNSHPTYAGIVDQTIDGQAMVKVPKFWFKTGTVPSGTYAGKRYWMISDRAAPGFAVHPAFMNYGAEVAQYWVGKYQGTNDGGTKLGSAAGVTPLVSIDFPTMQARATARNTGGVTGFGLWNIYQLSAIQTLALIEMGGSDSQTLIGQGHVSGSSALATDNATVAPSTLTCTSTAIAAPIRRVRRLCGSPTSGSAVTIPKISCSVSSGNERSSNSPSPVRIRSKATLKIKTATTNAAMGSAMRHRCPRK